MFAFTLFGSVSLLSSTEENFRPKSNSNQSFIICYWNFNSFTVKILKYLFRKLNNFDVVWILETCLDSATALDDKNLEIAGHNL